MEQQLINALICLLAKTGGESVIADLIRAVDENNSPRALTEAEIEKAVQYINWQSENYGAAAATTIIEALLKKYKLDPEYFMAPHRAGPN